jgi:hypothetical protein
VQSGAGHYPWLDDAGRFAATVTAFLDDRPAPNVKLTADLVGIPGKCINLY